MLALQFGLLFQTLAIIVRAARLPTLGCATGRFSLRYDDSANAATPIQPDLRPFDGAALRVDPGTAAV